VSFHKQHSFKTRYSAAHAVDRKNCKNCQFTNIIVSSTFIPQFTSTVFKIAQMLVSRMDEEMVATTRLVLRASFHDNLGRPVPECQTILGFAASRDDGCGSYDNQNYKMLKAQVTTINLPTLFFTFLLLDQQYQRSEDIRNGNKPALSLSRIFDCPKCIY